MNLQTQDISVALTAGGPLSTPQPSLPAAVADASPGEQPGAEAVVPTDIRDAHREAKDLLSRNELQAAIDRLSAVAERDPSAKTHGLLGTAYFRQEKYDVAAQHLEEAVKRDPSNKLLAEQLQSAVDNELSQVQNDVAANPWDNKQLFGPPQPGTSTIGPIVQPPPASRIGRILHATAVVGKGAFNAVAYAASGVVGGAMGAAMRLFGAPERGEVWTTWSRKNYVLGLLTLARMRDELNTNNLKNTYPDGQLVGFVPPGTVAPAWTKYARTADGSWNNPINPKEGAAGTRFGRNVDLEATRPDIKNLMEPSPREISRVLMTRDDGKMKEVPFLNLIAGAWIQFMVHDWVSHGDNNTSELYEIPLKPDDPVRQKYHMNSMFVPKTATDPTRRPEEAGKAPAYVNEVSSWWDGSQIYGSDLKTQMKLRSGVDGKMKVDAKGNIPVARDGVEETGFRRNWWLGLSLLHNLFVKEHNSICDMLKAKYPSMSDQELFDKARLINAAVMAKIHTVEWTPAILPNRHLNHAMKDNWWGAETKWLKKPEDRVVVTPLKLKDPVLGGIVGNATDKHGVPYSLTEEFVAVYRLHSLLPDHLKVNKIKDANGGVEIPLGQTRMAASHKITESMEMDDLLNAFGTQHPGQLVLNNYPKTLQELSVPGFAQMDLAAVDVLRDRERGIPRYNEFRRQIGLNPIKTFEDLCDDKDQVAKLKSVYGGDVEKIDLLIGTLAEGHRPENFGFGETLFQIFILNASRRLQADRFFTESYNAETYTPEGLKWIDEATMKSVLLRHHPRLSETGLANVDNAFEPWEMGPLDPSHHPLAHLRA